MKPICDISSTFTPKVRVKESTRKSLGGKLPHASQIGIKAKRRPSSRHC